jgi:hypothetical protein
MSSPSLFAGQKPYDPRAFSRRPDDAVECSGAHSSRAARRISMLEDGGKGALELPREKNMVQSM